MYDTKCDQLARDFLFDEPDTALRTEACISRLAQVIQTAIEDEIEAMRPVAAPEHKEPSPR